MKNKNPIPGVSMPSEDTIIWRYMSYARFEQMINTSNIYLARLDQFSDFKEGALTGAIQQRNLEEMREQGGEDIAMLIPWLHQFLNHKYWYASCWNSNKHESNLLWRSYGTPKNEDKHQFKIAIKSTVGKLIKSIEHDNLFIGRVNYLDFDNDDPFEGLDGIPSASLIYIKQKEYQDENEIRLVFEDRSSMVGGIIANLPETPKGFSIQIDLNQLIDEIYIEAIPVDWERLGKNNIGTVDIEYRNALDQVVIDRVNMIKSLLENQQINNIQIRLSSIL